MASSPISRSNFGSTNPASPSASPNRPLQAASSSRSLMPMGGLQGRGRSGSVSESSSQRIRLPASGAAAAPGAATDPAELRPQAEQLVGSVREHLQNLEAILPTVQAASGKAAASVQRATTLFETQVSQAPLELGPPARAGRAIHALEQVGLALRHLEHRVETRWTGRNRLQQALTQMRPIAEAIQTIRTSPQTAAFVAGLHEQQNVRLTQANAAVLEGADLAPARARLGQSTQAIADLIKSIADDGRATSATAASHLDTASRELLRTLPGVTASELHSAFEVAKESVMAAGLRLHERRTPAHLVSGTVDMLNRLKTAKHHLENLRESVEYQQLAERPLEVNRELPKPAPDTGPVPHPVINAGDTEPTWVAVSTIEHDAHNRNRPPPD